MRQPQKIFAQNAQFRNDFRRPCIDYAPTPKGYARFDEFDQPSTLRFMPSISSTPRANHFCTNYLGTSLILSET